MFSKKLHFPLMPERHAEDSQTIENALTDAICKIGPEFRLMFKGLSLGGSYLDGIKIRLPDEFDMHMKIKPNCDLKPIRARNHPGFVFLKASDDVSPFVNSFGCEGYFVDRIQLQSWLRNSINRIMPQLQNISCREGRVYRLEYTAQGHGVAHTILATEKHNPKRQIWFDFVPVFEFPIDKWPRGQKLPTNDGSNWMAVTRKYFGQVDDKDNRSFIECAPRWERMVMHEKQNLKKSLRLMKTLRDANNMPGLVSYFLKTMYLHGVDKGSIDWNQEPGSILICMLKKLYRSLRLNNLPFFLAPDYNNLDKLSHGLRMDYACIIRKLIQKTDSPT